MKAIITKNEFLGKNYGNKKELVDSFNVITWTGERLENPVTVRCYMGRSNNASVVYATIWVHGDNYCSGSGSAGGYGYHKVSAAVQSAITNAGIELYGTPYRGRDEDIGKSCSIDGVGDSAIEDALIAIAEAAGYHGPKIVVRN